MKTEIKHFCEKCNEEFYWEDDCKRHEETCGVVKQFRCDKCGKIIEYTTENEYDSNFMFSYNECWTFSPNHYRAGYGSGLDGCEFKLHICDDCLIEYIKTFKHQDHIWNSGSNSSYEYYEEDESEENI